MRRIQTRLTSQSLIHQVRFSKSNLAIVALIFAVVGGYILLSGHAAAGTANIFVSTAGSDTTCARSATAITFSSASGHICASFPKACSIAVGGDIVIVEDGTYPGVDLTGCEGKTSVVTFQTEPGHECPYSAATPYDQLPAQSSDTTCAVKINGELAMTASKTGTPANSPLKNLKFVGMYAGDLETLWAHNITFSHMATGFFNILASDSVSVLDSDIGNTFDGTCSIVAMQETAAGGSVAQPTNITIQRNIFHDSLRLNSSQGHPDGLFIYEMDGGVIDSNVMYRAGVIGIYMNLVEWAPLYGLGRINNIAVTNNVIHDIVDMTDTDGPTHSVPQSSLAPQNISLGDNNISNVTVAFNSVSGWIRRQDNTAAGGSGTGATTNLKIYGNIADGVVYGNSYGCPINSTIDYNYLYNSSAVKCGSHDIKGNGTTPFIADDTWTPAGSYYTVTPGNYALKAGTPPIDMVPTSFCTTNPGVCPATDFSGSSRPLGAAYDAGAYEAGGSTSPFNCYGADTSCYTPNACTTTITSGLDTAITNAAAGSTICLHASGSPYAAIANTYTKSSDVTIQPYPGEAVTINGITLWGGTDHIVFQGFTIGGSATTGITNSKITHSTFTGSLYMCEGTTCGGATTANANVLIDHDRFDGINTALYDGRVTVRGQDGGSSISGIIISNSHFGADGGAASGCTDGIFFNGNGNAVVGPGDEFSGFSQSNCDPGGGNPGGAHVDPIQFYGETGATITGNYFHDNSDSSGGLESFNDDGPATVTNNVFVCTCSYPYSVAAMGGDGWVVSHNTFAGGGDLTFQVSSTSSLGNIATNNAWINGGGIVTSSGWGTASYSLNSGVAGAGNINGTAVLAGGPNPTTYAGYALASNSPGYNAGSDGLSMGISAFYTGGGGSGDSTPPTVSLTAPANNATVSGSVTVSANASDNVGVAGVQFMLDGSSLGAEDTSSPYSTSWDSTQASNGTHTLTAVARDAAGNSTTSSSVTVTVTGGLNIINIGETNILGSADNGNSNLLVAQSATLSQTAAVQSLSFYVTTAAGNLRLGIYDASGPGGGPGNLLAQTAPFTPIVGWNTAGTTTTPSLAPGTYWLAYLPSSDSLAFLKADDASSSGKSYAFTYGALPNTYSTTPASTASHWSLYATLSLGGTSSIPGDLNNDGKVDISDLSILASHYKTSDATSDINHDGIVNVIDLSVLLSHYGG